MKLYSLNIEGLCRIQSTRILFGDATFLIGANNSGKSTVFKAIDYLLSAKKRLPGEDYFSVRDVETKETKPAVTLITLEAEFRNVPPEANSWRGFKGRLFSYETEDQQDSGLAVTYRKTYEFGQDAVVQFRSKNRSLDPRFDGYKTPQDLIDRGADPAIVEELFPELTKAIGKSAGAKAKLDEIDDLWVLDDSEAWVINPGGIPGNVLKMLPRFLLIPADTSSREIEGSTSGVLGATLNDLFQIVREQSANYQQAQAFLDKLSEELDPEDENSEFGKMLAELNAILKSVFPESELHAKTDLSDPDSSLKPTFKVEMSSNVRTPVTHQGSGMVRAAAFGMLRYRQKWLSSREDSHQRSLIVCFEEPEIYLHPSAANQMRDTIYDLSSGGSQIVATTHSPFLIDLSRKTRQILNNLRVSPSGIQANPFNVSDAYTKLEDNDKDYVKMLLRVDEHFARVFFTQNVIVIEGDTEDVVIAESLKRLKRDEFLRLIADHEIVKARGKASIIGVVKYLLAMGIEPVVVHDRDKGVDGAEKFNQPIADAVGSNGRVIEMHECIEDELGYAAPSSEKPFNAFKVATAWGPEWNDVPQQWAEKMKLIFGGYIP